jgi:hypothetical protein
VQAYKIACKTLKEEDYKFICFVKKVAKIKITGLLISTNLQNFGICNIQNLPFDLT